MTKEQIKELIIQLMNEKKSAEWYEAVYSFAKYYPDSTNDKKE